MSGPDKICAVCGRRFQWRKKWKASWRQVKYCSNACRRSGLTETDTELEETILKLLQSADRGGTICPSQAARATAAKRNGDQWHRLMEPARRAARRLAHRGSIQILQGGRPVDPSSFKGPVRLKRRRKSNRSGN
jgi:hypothetical protein